MNSDDSFSSQRRNVRAAWVNFQLELGRALGLFLVLDWLNRMLGKR